MTQTPGTWFTSKIRELAELLKRMPKDRQRAFVEGTLNEPGAPQRDDGAPDRG